MPSSRAHSRLLRSFRVGIVEAASEQGRQLAGLVDGPVRQRRDRQILQLRFIGGDRLLADVL